MSELSQRFRTKDKPSQNDFQDLIDTLQMWTQTAQVEDFELPDHSVTLPKFALGTPSKTYTTDVGGNTVLTDGPSPSGPAGGDFEGNYPNPTVKNNILPLARLLLSEASAAGIGAVPVYNGTAIVWTISASPKVVIKDVRASGVDGGTFSQGSWIIRTLNTLQQSISGLASLSGNNITLTRGIWYVRISCPAQNVSHNQSRLWNVTDGVLMLPGTSEQSDAAVNVSSRSVISGIFTITGSKTMRVEHRCARTQNNTGFGLATGFGINEVYTEGEFQKIG